MSNFEKRLEALGLLDKPFSVMVDRIESLSAELSHLREWEDNFAKAVEESETLSAENRVLRESLTVYADRQGWTAFVPDSYRGECWEFDWNGDLGDKPWTMAVNGLNASV